MCVVGEGGGHLIPGELVGWGEMLAHGGSVKSPKAGGLRDLGWRKNELGSHKTGLAGHGIKKADETISCLEPQLQNLCF